MKKLLNKKKTPFFSFIAPLSKKAFTNIHCFPKNAETCSGRWKGMGFVL